MAAIEKSAQLPVFGLFFEFLKCSGFLLSLQACFATLSSNKFGPQQVFRFDVNPTDGRQSHNSAKNH
jgi:hypothetical protein